MILLDTNVIVDATDNASPFKAWANTVIENAIADDGPGAAINAVTLAELCAASGVNENEVAGMLIDWGITIPARAARLRGGMWSCLPQLS